jgi:hypothetical protein
VKGLQPLTPETIDAVPSAAGVYVLYDRGGQVLRIHGVADLRAALRDACPHERASAFRIERDEMYTARESQLLQEHLSTHGALPFEDDDLF